MVCNSSIVFFGFVRDAEWVNFRLNEGEATRKPLSVNHLFRMWVGSISGFISRVVLGTLPSVLPLKSVRRAPLIVRTGGGS